MRARRRMLLEFRDGCIINDYQNWVARNITRMPQYEIAKELLTRACPTAAFRPQPAIDWQGKIPLPPAVAEYFAELGPVDVSIRGYGNPYFLPSLFKLWAHQTGYRIHGSTYERLPDWHDDWLVIADEGGDPFIFSRATGAILHAYHGEGVWEPALIFNNLVEMVTTFAIIGDIVASAGRDLTDNNSIILPRHREAARMRISEFLQSDKRAVTITSSLDWS